jgi:hypothetical protein
VPKSGSIEENMVSPRSSSSDDEPLLLSIDQNRIIITVSDLKQPQSNSRSMFLPWYGQSMKSHQIKNLRIRDFWLYIFTQSTFETFVVDLNRIAFAGVTSNSLKQFDEALVQYYLDHIYQPNHAKQSKTEPE